MKQSGDERDLAYRLVLIVQEATFTKLGCFAPGITRFDNWLLIRCPDDERELRVCLTRYHRSVVLVEDYILSSELLREIEASRINEERPRLIVRLDTPDSEKAEQLIWSGCVGIIYGSVDCYRMRRILKAIINGEMWVERKLLSSLLQYMLQLKHSL